MVIDSSKKDVGALIRLNSLQKRLTCIKHVVGDWQPSRRHKNVTEQVDFVQKRLDLLDAAKMRVFKRRATQMLMELEDMKDGMDTQKRRDELGHPKAHIE